MDDLTVLGCFNTNNNEILAKTIDSPFINFWCSESTFEIIDSIANKSASFSNVRALPFLLQDVKIADIPAIMGTIDLCVGDLDH